MDMLDFYVRYAELVPSKNRDGRVVIRISVQQGYVGHVQVSRYHSM